MAFDTGAAFQRYRRDGLHDALTCEKIVKVHGHGVVESANATPFGNG